MSDDVPGWRWTNIRRDGAEVVRNAETDAWSIVPNDERPEIDRCPCCDKPFSTARNAKFACNAIYPLEGTA
jgi:hypothetical protein